jgi:hypothetical protein
VAAVAAQEADSDVIPSQDGWWNRLQGPQEGEPASPIRGVIAPVPLGQTTVSADGLGVGAAAGDPDKVAAVGLVLTAADDVFVDSLVLTMRETAENGSNLNAGQAAIAACPITDFWAGSPNAEWRGRPACDDSRAVPGERADDGTWTFDLTSLGQAWVDGVLPENGVLLVEAVDAPQSFQVSLQNVASGGVTAAMMTTGGGFSGSGPFVAPDPEPARPAPGPVFTPAPVSSGAPVATPTTSLTTPTTPAPSQPVAAATPPLDADLWGNLPLGLIVWLPVALAAAVAMAYALGPAGRPEGQPVRAGGVSNVLAAREQAA